MTYQPDPQLIADVEAIYHGPTSFRDPTRPPTIGTAPPVAQPGRPPMSQRAVDVNTTILTSSVLTAVASGGVTGILWASGHADPTVVGLICAAPVGLAIPVVAFSWLVKRIKEAAEAAPPVINQTYTGDVYQQTTHTETRGLWANTNNNQ